MTYTVLYVDDATPKQKSFSSKKKALEFVTPIIRANSDILWIDGLVVGEYIKAELDGESEKLIKRLK
jgi:hypothetical protein